MQKVNKKLLRKSNAKVIPNGTGAAHRRHSLKMQSIYGNDARSLKLGKRASPITVSISLCAFATTAGCNTIDRMK